VPTCIVEHDGDIGAHSQEELLQERDHVKLVDGQDRQLVVHDPFVCFDGTVDADFFLG
jgi:hypothetical protein